MSPPDDAGAVPRARDDLPNSLPRPPDELGRLTAAWEAPRGIRAITETNNNFIGPLFVGASLLFLTLAGVLGLLIRAQLAMPGLTLLPAATYNQVFTMHGTVMMFLFAVPAVEAMGITLIPGMTVGQGAAGVPLLHRFPWMLA